MTIHKFVLISSVVIFCGYLLCKTSVSVVSVLSPLMPVWCKIVTSCVIMEASPSFRSQRLSEEPEIKKPTWGCPRGPLCLASSARGLGWGVGCSNDKILSELSTKGGAAGGLVQKCSASSAPGGGGGGGVHTKMLSC